MSRQHFIDQQGRIVYAVNDKSGNCINCIYNEDKRGFAPPRQCHKHVPAEHIDDRYPATLWCISKLKTYREAD